MDVVEKKSKLDILKEDLLKPYELEDFFNEEVKKRLEIDEKSREIGEYYILLDLMSSRETLLEVKRMSLLVENNPDEMDYRLKYGVVQRKLYQCHKGKKKVLNLLKERKLLQENWFERAIEIDPNNVQILYNMSVKYYNDNDKEAYPKSIVQFGEHHPSSPWFRLQKGNELQWKKEYDQAVDFFEKNMDILSTNIATHKYTLQKLWFCYARLKKSEKVREYIDDFNKRFLPNNDSSLGLHELGWIYLKQSRSERNKKKQWELLDKAEKYFLDAKKISSRKVNYSLAVVQIDRMDGGYYSREGLVYDEKKEYLKVISFLEKELLNAPYKRIALFMKHEMHLRIDQIDEAEEVADILVEVYGDSKSYRKKYMKDFPETVSLELVAQYLIDSTKPFEKSGGKESGSEDPTLYKTYFKIATHLAKLTRMTLVRDKRYDDLYRQSLENIERAVELKPDFYSAIFLRVEIRLFHKNFRFRSRTQRNEVEWILDQLKQIESVGKDKFMDVQNVYQLRAWVLRVHCKGREEESIRYGKMYIKVVETEFYDDEVDFGVLLDTYRGIFKCYEIMGDDGGKYRALRRAVGFLRKFVEKKVFNNAEEMVRRELGLYEEEIESVMKIHDVGDLLKGKGKIKIQKDYQERVSYFEDRKDDDSFYSVVDFVSLFGGKKLVVYKFLHKYSLL